MNQLIKNNFQRRDPCHFGADPDTRIRNCPEAGTYLQADPDPQHWLFSLVQISVADPDPGLGTILTPGSGIRDVRKSALGSGIRDEPPGSYFLELRNLFFAFLLKFFDEDPGSGMETVRIRDEKKSDQGSGINIPDPQHCYNSTVDI